MSSGVYTSRADNTHRQAAIASGMDSRLLFMCGCKANRQPGAVIKRGMPYRCADCQRAREAQISNNGG